MCKIHNCVHLKGCFFFIIMHLLFKTLESGCVCVYANDDDEEPIDEYIGRYFADVMSEFGLFIDESIKYFLAETETHYFKCRFWGNDINLYVHELSV